MVPAQKGWSWSLRTKSEDYLVKPEQDQDERDAAHQLDI